MRKYSLLQKVLALALTAVLVLGMVPNISLPAEAAENEASLTVSNKVADPETLNNWQDYYGDNALLPDGSRGISTWKAGGVWTDKSVFADDQALTDAGFPSGVTLDESNDFMVSLSALASNKKIEGLSTASTDTMLVLDLSNSMDNSLSVESMIDAANDTIDALLNMNVNNRIGVVLYSGNSRQGNSNTSTATVILPLDRYTTTTTSTETVNGQQVTKYHYLTQSGEWIRDDDDIVWDTTVSIAEGTLDSNGEKPTGSKNTIGGTYIQNGLYKAYQEFTSMTDKGVIQSGSQKGDQRTPILILMSDGAPTVATTDYYAVDTSNMGNGSSTNDRITFLTQLTAAWVKSKVGTYYNNTTAKFYTVGLGTANNENATAVLYPKGSNSTLVRYWTNFSAGESEDGDTVTIIPATTGGPGQGPGQAAWTLKYQSAAEAIGRDYVDMYKSASNTDELIAAFQQIVNDIDLQFAYSATLVESGEENLDGYITVEDELGSMMQVKDVKGIVIGSTLYSGEEFAKSMLSLGDGESTTTELGDEFVRSIKERLNITDTSAVHQLLAAAFADGQLAYDSTTGAYSNYIGWYGGENNAYLGAWDKDSGFTSTGAPTGAKYINQSYVYLGDVTHGGVESDMMHIIVMVRTEITNGHQTVLFRIPSALIPMVTYNVVTDNKNLETAEDITLTVTETDPIRLVYEVGLPSDVTDANLEQKVQEYLAKEGSNHIHKDEDGNYVFFANSWDDNHDEVAPNIDELSDSQKEALTQYIAESHFIPNTENERFYILEDSVVYTKSGDNYIPVTSGINANGTYYFARTIITVTGADGAAEAVTQYEQLYPATVANGNNFQENETTGYWEVKAGTPRQSLTALGLDKSENKTDTIAESDNLWVYIAGEAASQHNIYSFLGNNGKLTVTPGSGIKVTKNVTELADGADPDEKFTITVTLSKAEANAAVTDADGNALPAGTWETEDNKVFALYLANGETAYITGLTPGTTYTVEEAANDKYNASYTYENTAKTVVLGKIEGVTVTNEPILPGALYITKEMTSTHTIPEAILTGTEFDFEVTFVDADGNPIAETTFQLEKNNDATLTELATDENGVMRGKLKHGETVYIKGIPAGATVTVEEVNIPDNYTSTTYRSRNATGLDADTDGVVTILSDSNATVVVTNTYTPKSTSVDLDIAGTKVFDAEGNEAVLPSGSFTFKVQQWNGQAWVDMDGMSASVAYAAKEDGTKTFTIENVLQNITYTEAGIYTYQVLEVKGSVANVTYDRTLYTFTVTVTDNNGQLVATVTDLNNTEITDGSYEVTFENTFHTVPVSIDIVKELDNKSGNTEISKAGFQFVAKEAQLEATGGYTVKENGVELVISSDGAGEGRMTATYKEPGRYYYIVSEVVPDPVPEGWTYSNQEYVVEVSVGQDQTTGDLIAYVFIDGELQDGDTAVLTFTNTYDPKDAEVDLNVVPTVVKNLEGRAPKAGEFTFAIFEDGKAVIDADGSLTNISDAIATGTNDASGNVIFTPAKLTYDTVGKYEYDVVEVKGSLGGVTYDSTIYDLVVEVTDDGSGALKATYYFEDSVDTQIAFKNTYTADPTEAVIEGLKTIQVNSGKKDLTADDYTFGLYATDDEGNPVGEPLLTTKNLANGSFIFDAIEYTLADAGKTFTYVVMEIAPDDTTDGSYSAGGVDYSGQTFSVSVEVIDNGDGTLSTQISGNGPEYIAFVNTYSSVPATVSLSGTKTLNGRPLTEGEFKFALYTSDSNFVSRELVTDQITHNANGEITIDLGTLGMGYHYYVLKEVIPENRAPGIHYDASEYYITIQVIDSGNGQMSHMTTVKHSGDPNAVNPAIAFNNIYKPEPGELILTGDKAYEGGKALEDDIFSVGLYDDEGNLLDTALVKADGSFTFQALEYTADDVGKSYTYTVKEIIPQGATDNGDGTFTSGSNIYDGTIYTVVVTITDADKDGQLEITKTVTKGGAAAELSFTNTFVPDPINYQLKAKKTYEKGLKGNDFKFKLTSADDKTDVEQIKYNDADGNVTFDNIEFPAAGTYTFHVEEIDKILGFIDYSTAKYLVTIEVVNENGVLRVVEPISVVNLTDNSEGDLSFINTYKMDGEGEITLRGTKVLTGDRTTVNEGEFEFGLYDSEGNLIESVKNDANGNFAFNTLKFDETDVPVNGSKQITYTIREIPGGDPNMDYDPMVYTVVVTVKDNDKGGVDVSYTVNGKASGEIAIVFTNTFTEPDPAVATIYIQKKVINKTQPGVGLDGFAFILEQESGSTHTVTSNEAGTAGFQVSFGYQDVGKTYTFKVYEKRGNTPGMTYDGTVYTVTVKVELNPDGTIKTVINDVATNAIALEFTNTYEKPETPVTGDDFPIIALGSLMFISAAAFVVLMFTKKRKPGKYAR